VILHRPLGDFGSSDEPDFTAGSALPGVPKPAYKSIIATDRIARVSR
jgi:hypothetical protein